MSARVVLEVGMETFFAFPFIWRQISGSWVGCRYAFGDMRENHVFGT